MIKVNIDDTQYTVKELMKECTINDYQIIQNILNQKNNKKFDIFYKMSECILQISNIPKDVLDLINIVDLKKIFNDSTNFNFNKESVKIKNDFIINKIEYKTISKYKKYDDIVLNRLQYKLVNDVDNHILLLAGVVFLENNENDIRTKLKLENVENRVNIFKDKIKFKDILPFLMKWIETTNQLSTMNIK